MTPPHEVSSKAQRFRPRKPQSGLRRVAGRPVGFAAQHSASSFDSRPQAIHGLLEPDRATRDL